MDGPGRALSGMVSIGLPTRFRTDRGHDLDPNSNPEQDDLMTRLALSTLAAALAFAFVLLPSPGDAQEEEKDTGWAFTTEFSLVTTNGNSESRTFGLAGTALKPWQRSALLFEAGGTRTTSSLITRTATGTTSDFSVNETKVTETVADILYARGRYDYDIAPKFQVFGGADWLRNKPAGTESRFLLSAGVGNAWARREKVKFRTDYGITYTIEDNVVDNPALKTEFAGARLSYDLVWKAAATTEFISNFILDLNLDNTDDVRISFLNSLPIAVSNVLLFTPSYQILWRNKPNLTTVDLVDSSGTPTGDQVAVPLDEFDTFFSLALVLKY